MAWPFPTVRTLERHASEHAPGPPRALPGLPPGALLLNAYYLQESVAWDLRQGKAEHAVLEEILRKAKAIGASGLRTNAFNDGNGPGALQTSPLTYDALAFRALDVVLARAHAAGLKLVLPLGNAWDAYGGARRYVAWAGLPAPQEADARFFTAPQVVEHYRQHVAKLLSRVSEVDGLRYGEHPAVLCWELLNEPREAPRAWVDALGATVRAHAPGHLVSTGEEGFEPAWSRNLASPFVDVASVHCYPEAWGGPRRKVARAGASFISSRAAAARAAGKPVLLGELGVRGDGRWSLAQRRALLSGWLRCARGAGVAAVAPWLFAHDSRPPTWDPHSFYLPDAGEPGAYAELLRRAARGELG